MAGTTDLLLMQKNLRECASKSELGYLVVNDSTRIIDYQTAVFWRVSNGKGAVFAVSGIPEPVIHTPFADWIDELCSECVSREFDSTIAINADQFDQTISSRWPEFLPQYAVWVPLQNNELGGVLYAREYSWTNEECSLADYWSGAVSHSLVALERDGRHVSASLARPSNQVVLILISFSILVSMFFPVHQSVNAAAEIVARERGSWLCLD